MKKMKMITTQDHVLMIVETIAVNDEISCRPDPNNSRRAILPDTTTAIMCDGNTNLFELDSSNNWVKTEDNVSPYIALALAGEQGASSKSAVNRVVEVQAKDKIVLDKWKNFFHLTDEQVAIITDAANRESFVELFTFTDEHLVDSSTFSDLGTSSLVDDSEITIL